MKWSQMSGNARGAVLMVFNALIYSIMVLIIKSVSPDVPLFVIMFFTVATQLLFVGGRAFRRVGPLLIAGERRGAHVLRATALISSMLAGFYSVTALPLAISTSLSFSKAMFVTLFAALILSETVGRWRWMSVVIGFTGVVILSGPTGTETIAVLGVAAGVVSAATAAFGAIMTRRLASETSDVLLLNQSLVGTLVLAPLAFWTWQAIDLPTMGLLAMTGLLSVVGNTSMIAALRMGEASALAPVDFSRAIFAGVIGYLAFQETPGLAALVGMAIIVIGALMSLRQR
ncbi:DMT family transporter [Agrobacterium vaccinii]|uniref:DMT family transporter n=1 Tax=Agrobacterium vaccinii TaxID=2735528 RepID=UPI001E5D4422|nr:DMT family transporter [Agrobacterium vaccinii]UHS59027.1 DMT family transporter [Agrobacterium vaccinii]UHS63643.1 DMT family transporter [Agrobacterium vaccinii]